MRIVRLTAAFVCGLSLLSAAASAAGPEERAYAATAKRLATLTPGKPQSCISLSRSRSSSYLDPDTIVYEDSPRSLYVNHTSGGCRFTSDRILVSSTPSDQLCRGDIVHQIDSTSRIPLGSCALGDFVPYTR